MKTRERPRIGALALGGMVALGLISAAPAQAVSQPYCSPSVGCYRDPGTGQNVYAPEGITLTAQEKQWRLQCYTSLAAAGFGGAGAILGRNLLSALGAAFAGTSGAAGACTSLFNSVQART